MQSVNQVLIKGMNEWLPKWIADGWRNSAGKEVVNRDLWERLVRLANGHNIEWRGIPGQKGQEILSLIARMHMVGPTDAVAMPQWSACDPAGGEPPPWV